MYFMFCLPVELLFFLAQLSLIDERCRFQFGKENPFVLFVRREKCFSKILLLPYCLI